MSSTWQNRKLQFKPCLGAGIRKGMTTDEFFSHVLYPVIVTPKFDGIRCITMPGEDNLCRPVCRSLELVPNDWIRKHLERLPAGLDGELITYDVGDLLNRVDKPRKFYQIQSDVMGREGFPLFRFHVFDHYAFDAEYPWLEPYCERLHKLCTSTLPGACSPVTHKVCNNREDIELFEEACIRDGYEGICWRHIKAPYKHGRSTLREQILIKMKRFVTAEARVIGCYEEMHNNNTRLENTLGELRRSSERGGMSGKGTLGGFIVEDLVTRVQFNVGSGFTAAQRNEYWIGKELCEGKIITYKHQPHGQKEKPRTPIFLGFRDVRDM